MTTTKKFAAVFALLLALAMLPLTACSPQGEQAQSSSSSQVQSSSESSTAGSSEPGKQISVTVQVDAAKAEEAGADISALEEIADPKTYDLEEGSTAYDALVATGAKLEGAPSYVTSIDGLAEGAAGKSSGWMYEVNGEMAMVAANEYVLQENDAVRWYYSSWE